MTKDEFLESAKNWNIYQGRGWAKIVWNAYEQGWLGVREDTKYELEDLIRWKMCNRCFVGPFAWVTGDGTVITADFGQHHTVAKMLFGGEREAELVCARVSMSCKSFDETWKHLPPDLVTERMKEAVVEHMMHCSGRWGFTAKLKRNKGEG